jgi:2'-5' RNA ligase
MAEITANTPLIITLMIDPASQDFFSAQRQQYFPAHANYLDAHLTLFHKLPSYNKLMDDTLLSLSNRPPFEMMVTGLKSIGNGVAYAVESNEVQQLHVQMQQAFDPFLIGKDRQKIWPHITIQNKVTAYKAQTLLKHLSENFEPFPISATGFATWYYLKGPWQKKAEFFFAP